MVHIYTYFRDVKVSYTMRMICFYYIKRLMLNVSLDLYMQNAVKTLPISYLDFCFINNHILKFREK